MQILRETPESPPWMQIGLALVIGAICEGDEKFFDTEWAMLIFDALGFNEEQIEHCRFKAKRTMTFGLFATIKEK